MINRETARRAAEEYHARVQVVKKSSKEYAALKDPLPCPSVAVNGSVIARNDLVAEEALREALEAAA